jgi:hypothetical protein
MKLNKLDIEILSNLSNQDAGKHVKNLINFSKKGLAVISQIKRFVKPTVEEISNYCNERGNKIDPQQFFDFYESKGWKIGKSPMKDWKSAIRTWERNKSNSTTSNNTQSGPNIIGRMNEQTVKQSLEFKEIVL